MEDSQYDYFSFRACSVDGLGEDLCGGGGGCVQLQEHHQGELLGEAGQGPQLQPTGQTQQPLAGRHGHTE